MTTFKKIPQFQILRTFSDQIYIRLVTGKGKIILKSEGCLTKEACDAKIVMIKDSVSNDERFEEKSSTDNQFYFELKAANGEVIGVGERYATQLERKAAIKLVKDCAPDALVEYRT